MEAVISFIAGAIGSASVAAILMMCLMADIRDALRRIATELETRKGE